MAGGIRRRGREAALQQLYQIDVTGDESTEARDMFWLGRGDETETAELREFVDLLVGKVLTQRTKIDALIDAASKNWDVERFSKVDLALLRLSTAEILSSPEVPGEVVVNEAVEIARRFSDTKSASFINGVLDRIAREEGRLRGGSRA
jgi:N utilization substance protein B